MDLHQLRCFVAAAEELHFGRAAQRLDMLPSALGRFIRLLEDDLGTRLMTRTTRSVVLTDDGAVLLKEARTLLAQADALAGRFRTRGRKRTAIIRVGAIDSAAAGLLPRLLHDFRQLRPDVTVQLVEDKTVLPSCVRRSAPTSGWSFCSCCMRPPSSRSPSVTRWRRGNA